MKYARLEYSHSVDAHHFMHVRGLLPTIRRVQWPLAPGPRRVTEFYVYWRNHQWHIKFDRQ